MSKMIDSIYFSSQPVKVDEELKAACKACGPYWDRVQEAFSYDFVNSMQLAVNNAFAIESMELYERGFVTGARLMLEILSKDLDWEDRQA